MKSRPIYIETWPPPPIGAHRSKNDYFKFFKGELKKYYPHLVFHGIPGSNVEWGQIIDQEFLKPESDIALLSIPPSISIPRLAKMGVLHPIDELLDKKTLGEIKDVGLWRNFHNGRLWGFPKNIVSGLLYLNRKLMKRLDPPRRMEWAEFVKQCQFAKKSASGIPLAILPKWLPHIFVETLWSNGGCLLTSDGRKAALGPRALEAWNHLAELDQRFKVFPSKQEDIMSLGHRFDFMSSKVAFLRDISDFLAMTESFKEKESDVDPVIFLPPIGPNGNATSGPLVFGPNYVIPKNTRHLEAAKALLQMVANPNRAMPIEQSWRFPFTIFKPSIESSSHYRWFDATYHSQIAGMQWPKQDVIHLADCIPLVTQFVNACLEGRKPKEAMNDLGEGLEKLMGNEDRSDYISRGLQFMQKNYQQPGLSRNEIAKAAGISNGYFSTIFAHETGRSIRQHLQKLRIDEASKLLKEKPHLSIREIAEQCGIEDYFYFQKLFKKLKGMTPKQFRQSL